MTQEGTIPKICQDCNRVFSGGLSHCPDDGAELQPLQGYPPIGSIFAERYEIMSILGFGGMSIVYKARHKHMDRIVAIKVLHPTLMNDPVALERFQQESKAAASLTHPNVVTVYDFGISPDGQAFFVMDCLEGTTLDVLIDKEGYVAPDQAIVIFRQICDGLDAAHKKAIIHRDLKPPNIALIPQQDGSILVKILDFGVAKFLPNSSQQALRLTQTGEVFGSPLYMSPEQCLGKKLDQRSDLYSLGCLMYETLTGIPAVIAESFLEALNKHVGEPSKPFKEVAPLLEIPIELETIVFKCLVKDPAQRYQSAFEVKEDLSSLGQLCRSEISPDAKNTIKQTRQSVVLGKRPITINFKTDSKTLTWFSGLTGGLLTVLLAFIFLWPGPHNDPGTPFDKLKWTLAISAAEKFHDTGDYAQSIRCTEFAKAIADKFQDHSTRLLSTLNVQAKIFRDAGQYANLKKVSDEISAISAEKIQLDYEHTLYYINGLMGAKDSISSGIAAVAAEATAERVFAASDNLASIGKYAMQETLLKRCKQVFQILDVRDGETNAKLDWQLADALLLQQRTPDVRTLLVDGLEQARNIKTDSKPICVIQALLRLGIFDKDQSNYTQAEPELEEAVTLSKKQDDKSLAANCLNAYADYFHQLKKDDQAKALFAEADRMNQVSAEH